MALEDELREVLAFRNEMLVELAVALLQLTLETGVEGSRIADRGIVGGKYATMMTDIEALTAVILQRCGMPWDSMAARVDKSRQALHRRLSARGEKLFEYAVRALQYEELDREVFLERARAALAGEAPFPPKQPVRDQDIREALESMPSAEEILSAPSRLAAALGKLRRVPDWWKRGWWDL